MFDAAEIQKNWQERGFSFGIWQDPPGQIWENYIHPEDELFMLEQGEVTLIVGDKIITPAIGEEIFIPANTRHTVKTSSKADSRWYYGYGRLNKK